MLGQPDTNTGKKVKLYPTAHIYKIQLNMDQTPKYKIMKLLEDNVEVNLCELG